MKMTLHLKEALTGSLSLASAAKLAVEDAIDLYDNEDALARRKAIAAFEQDRPAYWTTAGYHSQKACALQVAVHEMPLPRALKMIWRGGDYIAALDTLVPLNEQAAIALTVQYAEYGLWRDIEEVLARRYRRMK
jgi:hypothetical protein